MRRMFCMTSKLLHKYEYISFDIFDTLVKRDLERPADVFLVVEKKYQMQTGMAIDGFAEKRITAEKKARKTSRYSEITFDEIYAQLPYPQEVRDRLQQLEIQTEFIVCTANKSMLDVYNSLLKAGKKLYLISDMYLPENTIRKILQKCGVCGYQQLYLSNSFRCRKRGGLFDEFIRNENLNEKKVAHVGDNLYADVISARYKHQNIFPFLIPKNIVLSAYKTAAKDHSIATNITDNFISNHLDHNANTLYQLGYMAYGPLLYSFVRWLANKLEQDHREKILFLARDCYVIQKGFHLLCDWKGKDYYFYISRNSVLGTLLKNNYSVENILTVLPQRSIFTLRSLLKRLNGENERNIHEANKMGIDLDVEIAFCDCLERMYSKKQLAYLNNVSANQKSQFIKEKMDFERYLGEYIASYDKIAVVDVGWKGTMQNAIEIAASSAGIPVDVKGYYIGLDENSSKKEFQFMESYLDCKNGETVDLANLHTARGIIELFFSAPHGMTIGYEEKNGKIYPILDGQIFLKRTKNNDWGSALEELQAGALAFVEQFNSMSIELGVELTPAEAIRPIFRLCAHPRMDDLETLGDIEFQEGKIEKLAHPDTWFTYLRHPRQLKSDLYASCWKAGFIKRLLHGTPFSYYFVYRAEKKRLVKLDK